MAMKKRYYTVNGEIIGEKAAGGERIDYLPDALGNVVATVDQNGKILNSYHYKPFGGLESKTGTAPDPKFLWVGAHGYRQTGNKHSDVYVRARHYDTRTGRWTSRDPLWQHGLTYVGNNPTTYFDPLGLYTIKPIDCKDCGKTLLITPEPGDKTGIVVGPPGRGRSSTKLISGAQCLDIVKQLYPGKQCVCVNGGFFDPRTGDPLGALDPCNSRRVSGIGSPAPPGSGRQEVIVRVGDDFVTGVVGTPPSPGGKNRPGRTGACLDQNGKMVAIIVGEGCAAKRFEGCARTACPKGTKFVWLDGGGSAQVWQNGQAELLGNSSRTGKPDRRPVDNWIIICE
jgi:RHS repeat-associated protein